MFLLISAHPLSVLLTSQLDVYLPFQELSERRRLETEQFRHCLSKPMDRLT